MHRQMALSEVERGSDGLLGLAISGRLAQDLAAMWRPYNANGPAGQATSSHDAQSNTPRSPVHSRALSFPLLASSFARASARSSAALAADAIASRLAQHCARTPHSLQS